MSMVKHFFLTLIFLGLFASCSKEGPLPFGKKKTQAIHINYIYSPFSVDPRKGTDPVTTVTNYMLYEGLTRLEPDGTVVPAIAERIKISKDRKKYVFFLRKSMWSDGSPLTAYHFEAAWKKALSPDFPSRAAHLLFPIKNAEAAKISGGSIDEIGVEAIDDQTLLVRLKRPTPYFLQLTAYPTYFPVPHNGDEVPHPNQKSNLLTNGPFRLLSWRDDDEIITVKNPYYWNAEEVKLEEIHATIISNEETALKLFDQGKLDFVGAVISPLPLDAIATLKNSKHLHHRAIAGTTFASFNVNQFPFNNINIRKAFAYAVNREEITNNVSQLFDEMASGPIPQVLKETAKTLYEDYNHAAALHHFEIGLQELGITRDEFPSITYCYFASELQRNLALALQNQWKTAIGIEVHLEASELKSHLAKLHNHQFQIGQMSWIAQYHDQMCFLERFVNKSGPTNYPGWENPHFQRLIDDSFYKEHDKRIKRLDRAEQLLMSEMPIIPIYHFHAVYVKNPRLKKLAISPLGDVQFHKAYIE